jgi:hypothetical protein
MQWKREKQASVLAADPEYQLTSEGFYVKSLWSS